MFVTVNHIPAEGAAGPALESRFRARQRLVDQLPGFGAFELLRPHQAGEYLVMTSWASRADFEAWRSSPQQRPVRPAQAGHLSQPDVQSWPTFHETVAERRAPAWPPPAEGAVLTIEPVDAPPETLELPEGCLSVATLRTVEGNWEEPAESGGPAWLLVSRWTGGPTGGRRGGPKNRPNARTYDILQPSYAGQSAPAR